MVFQAETGLPAARYNEHHTVGLGAEQWLLILCCLCEFVLRVIVEKMALLVPLVLLAIQAPLVPSVQLERVVTEEKL